MRLKAYNKLGFEHIEFCEPLERPNRTGNETLWSCSSQLLAEPLRRAALEALWIITNFMFSGKAALVADILEADIN